MEYLTQTAWETQELGQSFGASLKKGGVLALVGDLGAGKTTFVQGLAKGLGIKERITSPTFILVRSYQAQKKGISNLYHVDLYRLEKNVSEEIENLGLPEVWADKNNLVVVEWAERARETLPKGTVWITFANRGEGRKITIEKGDQL